jgi:membrane protein DedA with SNARE-associated domain
VRKKKTVRLWLLWGAVFRAALGIIAIPLAPFLYRDHFLILVLLRPTKEVLLAGGFLARIGNVNLLEVLVAAIPLMVLGVWHFYYLGRQYSSEIRNERLPFLGSKILPSKRIDELEKVLGKKGPKLVFLGRLAVFPSALLGAAAGSSEMKSKEFLLPDALGAMAAFVEVVGAGFLFGAAFKQAGPWITAGGVSVLALGAFLFGRYIRRI